MALCRLPSPGRRFGCAGTQKELRPGLWGFENRHKRNRPTAKASAGLLKFSSIEFYQTRFTPFPAFGRRYRTTRSKYRGYHRDSLTTRTPTHLEKLKDQSSNDC